MAARKKAGRPKGRPKKEKEEAAVASPPAPVPATGVSSASARATPVAEHDARELVLSAPRNFFRLKTFRLMQDPTVAEGARGQHCAELSALYEDIENVLIWFETKPTREVVLGYVRLSETILYWRDYAGEQKARIHRLAKKAAASADGKARTALVAGGLKTTEAQVTARVAMDDPYQLLVSVEEDWASLRYQLQNLIDSLTPDVLVQASVWTQKELVTGELGGARVEE